MFLDLLLVPALELYKNRADELLWLRENMCAHDEDLFRNNVERLVLEIKTVAAIESKDGRLLFLVLVRLIALEWKVIDPASVFFTLSFLVAADTKDLFETTCVTADDAER